MHIRFPVTERAGDPQGIVGYVNFKELVGDIEDEFDSLPVPVVRSGVGWVVGGGRPE